MAGLDQSDVAGALADDPAPGHDPGRARIGVIDVGSNSVRMVVFDGMARSPAYFYNEKVLCGLGAGLAQTGQLNASGKLRALAALHRFAALAERMGLGEVQAVATAAVREAADGAAFCRQVAAQTGLYLHIASGEEEARLAAKGVLLGWPDAAGVVSDIGGASMELAAIRDGAIGPCLTSRLGPLPILDIGGDQAARRKYVRKGVKELARRLDGPVDRLCLVGGSWRAIARLDMERRDYPLKVLHEYRMDPGEAQETAAFAETADPKALSAMTGISTGRMSLVPQAALVLGELIDRLKPASVMVSSYGLREGLLYRMMPPAMRALDPLIEACRSMEALSARCPGFGDALYRWLSPLYADRDPAEHRLIRAACLLHDINWRGHPDYRAELCFDAVTRANMGGIDHPGRVFLGLAIVNRYKSGGIPPAFAGYARLLSEDRRAEAETLGRAMRLGAMLSGASIGVLERAPIAAEEGRLVLTLQGDARIFMGEVVEKRLHALAQRLGLAADIRLR